MNWHHPHAVAKRAEASRWVMFVAFGVLLAAFFRAQVLESRRYELQSQENRLRPVPLPAPRALITDRNGVVLADNVPGYSIAVMASSIDSLRATLKILSSYVTLDSSSVKRIVRRFRRTPYEPAVVRRDAPFDLVSALEESRVRIPRLVIQTEPKRWYPDSSVVAHVVGYVGEITEGELSAGSVPGARGGTIVGRDGLERSYDSRLRGEDGVRFIEVDALGRTVRDLADESTLEPRQPDTLRTTLDIGLQHYVAAVFPHGARGAVMAMDPRNGEVLALYSAPSFDPNLFVGGMDPGQWNSLSGSPDQPLFNRAIEGRYPPASPWKLAVAASALKRGIVTLDSHMDEPCRGGLQYGNRYFRCWKREGHGDITLREAIQYSCDVYFYQLGLKLRLPNLLHDGVEMGFRQRSGIDLPGEAIPEFPGSIEYYNRRFGPRGWTSAVTLNLAIGQGENAQSLSNMMRFYSMLANPEGSAPEPRLVKGEGSGHLRSLGLSRAALSGLRDALVAVVQTGTASGSRIADLKIAGKTGTAQNSHGPDHGWFVAFAPADNPVIVVGAIVEFAEHGSRVAPMVTRIIAHQLLGPSAPELDERELELVLPADSAPVPRPLLPDTSLLRAHDQTQSR
ncbi:MAG: penicillin-binding protein 2 [Gemmatimonadales bacterium]